MSEPIRLIIPENPLPRLDKALFAALPEGTGISRTKVTKLIQEGHITREGGEVVTGPKVKPQAGEVFLLIPPPDPVTAMVGEDIPLEVLFEDDDLMVINKPVGLVMHPAPGAETGTLVNAVIHHVGEGLKDVGAAARPGIVHRIDKDTSGIVVVAKTSAAHTGLSKQFSDHSINRQYLAVTKGVPDRGDARIAGLRGVGFEDGGVIRVATQFGRHPSDRKKMAVLREGGRHAITRFVVEDRLGADFALIRCRLQTGRTHQIRVHLGYLGHGLVGDKTYGTRRSISADYPEARAFPRQALHAAVLGFVHPITGEDLLFETPVPEDMATLCAALAGEDPNL